MSRGDSCLRGDDDRGIVRRGRAFAKIAFAGLTVLFLASCATRPPARPATSEEAAKLLTAWADYRRAALARGPTELFYDAEVSRSVVTMSGTLAVRDDPGKTLALRVQGPLGLPVARADWNGEETKVVVSGSRKGERTIAGDADLGRELGFPVTAAELSLLLYGLPDSGSPEKTELAGTRAWFSWKGGALRCDFDPSTGRVGTVVSRGERDSVEVRFLDWSAGLPSRIQIKTSRGGSARLVLRSAEAGSV
jgi:hypothetical protein